jgi:hypothetical protein
MAARTLLAERMWELQIQTPADAEVLHHIGPLHCYHRQELARCLLARCSSKPFFSPVLACKHGSLLLSKRASQTDCNHLDHAFSQAELDFQMAKGTYDHFHVPWNQHNRFLSSVRWVDEGLSRGWMCMAGTAAAHLMQRETMLTNHT